MGPTCGLLLGDLGADVIKVEPLEGEGTRRLRGSGAGFFPTFNRNKKSIALDLKHAEGRAIALRLAASADIVAENFRPDVMRRLGLDYESVKPLNERLVYVSHKGFLPGPYEHRTALDEVVQMMGGLAYMTGPVGRPLRAGSSVNDIMGGMFGALAALAALRERDATGRGQLVQSGLFENNAFLVAQHIMQYAVTGEPAAPMPSRVSAWAIYDVFTVAGGEQVFLAVVSDTQWQAFCEGFGFADWLDDAQLATNNQRVAARERLLPRIRAAVAQRTSQEVQQLFEQAGLPFAPLARPHDLLDDPHLKASGGLATIRPVPGEATETQMPLLPVILDGQRPGVRLQPPAVGEHTSEVLAQLGYTDVEIRSLRERRIAA
jgi:crotonobetainyl-CoA:carnitine CoA-transferase CaiB-like acyl-CoA transferase